MALVLADRVKETTTTTGTGTVTLAGAATGYQSFSAIGNANTTYYCIAGQTTSEWEVGIGTYTSAGTTLSRDTVLASSAGGTTKVTFSAGTKDVFATYPAEKSVNLDSAGNVTLASASALANSKIKAYNETTTVNATVTTTYTVDLSTANIFSLTLTGNTTFTFSNPVASGSATSFTLIIKQDATGSRTATWPAAVKWPNASTPTLTTAANKTDILNFITVDGGTTYFGSLSLANM